MQRILFISVPLLILFYMGCKDDNPAEPGNPSSDFLGVSLLLSLVGDLMAHNGTQWHISFFKLKWHKKDVKPL